jgi:peptidoglycan-associated lipoprotein
MRCKFLYSIFALLGLSLLTTGCGRSSGSTWEDTKTLGRYIQRGSKLLFKQNPDSKQIQDGQEFTGPMDDEFIPLNQQDLRVVASNSSIAEQTPEVTPVSDVILPSASETRAPSIESFKKPSHDLATVFKTVHFNTDDHVLRENQSLAIVDNISNYMKKHKELYVFILGHCDERASEAYNLALGTKRASYVRNLLVKKGVDPNHIFTISFGKELPIDTKHSEDAWAKNRRAEFKIYEKSSTNIK